MKCSACGSDANADARFCSNCGAKLNPVASTLFKPSPQALGTAVAAAGPTVGVGPTPRPLHPVGWLLLIVAIATVGYFVYRALGQPGPEHDASPVSERARPATAAHAPAAMPAPVPAAIPAPVSAPPSAPPSESFATRAAQEPVQSETTAPPSAPSDAAPATAAPAKPKRAPRVAKAAPPSPPPEATAVPSPPPPVPVTVAEPARPDRFAQLGDALARCRGRELFSRAVCEQRARLQYCDGYWDQVPLCSGAGKLNPQTN